MTALPTHSTPVWHLIVGSYTEGWEYAIEDGQVIDPAAQPVVIADGFTFAWRYPKGAYPAQLEPDVASWSLRCAASADVPDVAQGDHVYVRLYRPGGVGTTVDDWGVYFTFDGTLQEPEAVATPGGGMVLNLIASDLTAALAEVLIGGTPFPSGELLTDRLGRISTLAKVNINHTHPAVSYSSPLGLVDVDNKSALDVLRATLAGALFNGQDQLVLRGVRQLPAVVDPAGDGWLPGAPFYPTKPVTYFLQPLNAWAHGGGPYEWQNVGGVLTTAPRDLVTAMSAPERLVLPAGSVTVPGTAWRKSRADATNQIKLNGLGPTGEAVSGLAQHPDLVDRYGANTRTVDSYNEADPLNAGENRLNDYAKALLPEHGVSVPQWSLPSFVLRPDALTDAQLDAVVPKLYPHAVHDINAYMQLPTSLLGIAPAWALTGPDVHGVLTGATFTISRGRLAVTGELNGWKLRPLAPTWAQLRAAAETNTVKWRTGTVKLDPSLSWQDTRQIGAI